MTGRTSKVPIAQFRWAGRFLRFRPRPTGPNGAVSFDV